MQEKPPFSSYLDFFSNVCEGDTPSHTHPMRIFILSSGTPLLSIMLSGNCDFFSFISNLKHTYFTKIPEVIEYAYVSGQCKRIIH